MIWTSSKSVDDKTNDRRKVHSDGTIAYSRRARFCARLYEIEGGRGPSTVTLSARTAPAGLGRQLHA